MTTALHWSPVLTPVKLISEEKSLTLFSPHLVNRFVACMKPIIFGSENLSTMSVTLR